MARRTTITVKLSDEEKDTIDRLAREAGLVSLDGKPNRSAWVRLQIQKAVKAAQWEAGRARPFL